MEKMDLLAKKYYKLFYGLLLAGGTLMYLVLCVSVGQIWADEAYTFAVIHHSFSEIWTITAADVHPPLYYFMLKLFSAPFQYSFLSAKIFSIIPFVLMIAVGGVQIKRLFDAKTALLFMALFLLFPFSMMYAVEVRMYSLAALFVFLNAIYAYRCWREAALGNWILSAVFGACAAYTHYYALVSAGIIYGLLLLAILIQKKKLLKYWLLMSMLTVLAYLPWLNCFLEQIAYKINNEYWIPAITPITLLGYVYNLFNSAGNPGYCVLFSLCYTTALGYILLEKNKKDILIALSALAVPVCTIGVGIAASIIVRPVFVIHYVIPSIPCLVFFMAFSIGKMKGEFIVSSIMTVALIGGVSHFSFNFINEWREKDEIDDFVAQYGFADAYVFLNPEYDQHPPTAKSEILSYYDPATTVYIFRYKELPNSPYHNLKSGEKFDMSDNPRIVFFISSDSDVPEEFTSSYEIEKIKAGIFDGYDSYLMTLKVK